MLAIQKTHQQSFTIQTYIFVAILIKIVCLFFLSLHTCITNIFKLLINIFLIEKCFLIISMVLNLIKCFKVGIFYVELLNDVGTTLK